MKSFFSYERLNVTWDFEPLINVVSLFVQSINHPTLNPLPSYLDPI